MKASKLLVLLPKARLNGKTPAKRKIAQSTLIASSPKMQKPQAWTLKVPKKSQGTTANHKTSCFGRMDARDGRKGWAGSVDFIAFQMLPAFLMVKNEELRAHVEPLIEQNKHIVRPEPKKDAVNGCLEARGHKMR